MVTCETRGRGEIKCGKQKKEDVFKEKRGVPSPIHSGEEENEIDFETQQKEEKAIANGELDMIYGHLEEVSDETDGGIPNAEQGMTLGDSAEMKPGDLAESDPERRN